MTPSSFAQPTCKAEDIRAQQFLLGYYGRGAYSAESVGRMSLDELNWHATKLVEHMKEESRAQKEAMRSKRR